jgi:signal transduction histidine kinase
LDISETPKEYSFCAHAINDSDNVFIVQDARKDERFHDNPFVSGEPYVIFYAGVPLVSQRGLPVGTLCVIDYKPKLLNQSQIRSLQTLSNQVVNLLELRKKKLLLEQALDTLEQRNYELERFANIAAHDIKSPLRIISSLIKLFRKDYGLKIDSEGQNILELIGNSAIKLHHLVEGLLDYSKSEKILKEKKSEVNLETLKNDIAGLFTFENNCDIVLKSKISALNINKTAIEQILINLVANAVKYNDKKNAEIEIEVMEYESNYEISVQDNGPGIPKEHQEKIFKIFEVLSPQDRFGQSGNGIGLATVKKLFEALDGKIFVESEIGKETKFIFTIKKQ